MKRRIGIDLGTTHCVMAERRADGTVVDVPIPQLTAPGEVCPRSQLPSFLFLPHPSQFAPGALQLPWRTPETEVAGELARSAGATTPNRLVASAKSWLCHPTVDRRAAILPIDVVEGERQLSPLDASAAYLTHLRSAWDTANPESPLVDQDVVLTVPASFDPAARELTSEAARRAGITHFSLMEEPQAALYAWLAARGDQWRNEVSLGDSILVVDIGGGTTDFSLIAVREIAGTLELERVAVGDHILLGGDNIDFALAFLVKQKLESEGREIDEWQVRSVVHACRAAKEALLSGYVEEAPVVVPGRGSRLIGGTLRTSLTRNEVISVVLEGFFPEVSVEASPRTAPRSALTQIGLPYANDTSITAHLAAFLRRQRGAVGDADVGFAPPTHVLFNGGVLKAELVAERLMQVLGQWNERAGTAAPRRLAGGDLDHAVARGAAYYAHVREDGGMRIRGGTAHAYYVGVETSMPSVPGMPRPVHALCVAPFGMEEGTVAASPPQELGLVVGESVHFRFFGSTVRRGDTPGAVLTRWKDDELIELGEIRALLEPGGRLEGEVVPVRLRARVDEVGTLALEAIPRSGDEVWRVEVESRGRSSL